MILTIELPPELEALFSAEAGARGIPLQEFVIEWLSHNAPKRLERSTDADEAERLLDELADSLPDMPVLSDEALRREQLYPADER